MRATRWALVGAGIAAGTVVVARSIAPKSPGGRELEKGRWRSVTIDKPVDEVLRDGIPEPLAALGDLIEVRATDAPGGRGTELSARLVDGEPTGAGAGISRLSGTDPRQAVRTALREAKQLIEVGEVIRLDPKPEGHRKNTPFGAIVDMGAKRSGGEGVL